MDYIFAAARVRSVEKNLLNRERADKMIESKTPEEALKILRELGYGSEEGEAVTLSVDGMLSGEIKKAYDFITGIAPDPRMFDTLLYPYDYHNLKVILKAEFLGIEAEPFVIHVGTVAAPDMEVMVRDRSFMDMPEEMARAVAEVVEVFGKTSDPQVVDLILDRACYESMSRAAITSENEFLIGYVNLLVDTINLKTFVRMREMGKGWDFFSRVFIPGGSIAESIFLGGFDESYEQFAQKLLSYGLMEVLEEGAEPLKENGRFTLLEKLCDDRIIDYISKAKYISFGAEPLAAYLIAKEGDVRNARIIMAGLAQGLPTEQIRERQRDAYV